MLYGCDVSLDGRINNRKGVDEKPDENIRVKVAMQGLWIDGETLSAVFYVRGDSIFFEDASNIPVFFYVADDTLYLVGQTTTAYYVPQLSDDHMLLLSESGSSFDLIHSDDPTDSLSFFAVQSKPVLYTEVVKKDSVLYYQGMRFHSYATINPSTRKVYKTTYTDEGMAVENLYFDNVINICIYRTKNCVFSRDCTKDMFTELIPEDFLRRAILSDMSIGDADADGCHFYAEISIPDDVQSYMIDMCVDYKGVLTMVREE